VATILVLFCAEQQIQISPPRPESWLTEIAGLENDDQNVNGGHWRTGQ